MAGKICKVLSGLHEGRIATVDNKQDPAFVKAGKVHVFFFEKTGAPYLKDGRHVSGLISPAKLKSTGFYD